MRIDRRDLLWGRLALLGAGVLWSLGGVGLKSLTLSAIAIAGYRCPFAALTLAPGAPHPPRGAPAPPG